MQKQAKKYYTPAEYLALEEAADYKNEYYRGEIYTMAGATINHNRIVGNLYAEFNLALKNTKCEAFMSDMRIWVEARELFTYPDLIVLCDKPQFYPNRNDTITNPLIIVEVLSESTKNYDRGEKFQFYRSIPSFQEYILIDQSHIHVEHFYIGQEDQWILKEYNDLKNVLKLFKIDFEMPLQDIYDRVTFNSD